MLPERGLLTLVLILWWWRMLLDVGTLFESEDVGEIIEPSPLKVLVQGSLLLSQLGHIDVLARDWVGHDAAHLLLIHLIQDVLVVPLLLQLNLHGYVHAFGR